MNIVPGKNISSGCDEEKWTSRQGKPTSSPLAKGNIDLLTPSSLNAKPSRPIDPASAHSNTRNNTRSAWRASFSSHLQSQPSPSRSPTNSHSKLFIQNLMPPRQVKCSTHIFRSAAIGESWSTISGLILNLASDEKSKTYLGEAVVTSDSDSIRSLTGISR
ncbi:hypothetical protein M501DRAFT_1014384 [Patellaria atrata CBS 101060]|uniref:Uncharacterized protein n=1 Tax=Patellaria atrata CBS 101060 TaxID=1346257 RepID=A0A9P4SFS3_9PEZI|nr:hypothetical protein M501DRAFT_1014384 [Patellaria atrata CBS 101060]